MPELSLDSIIALTNVGENANNLNMKENETSTSNKEDKLCEQCKTERAFMIGTGKDFLANERKKAWNAGIKRSIDLINNPDHKNRNDIINALQNEVVK